MATDPGPFTELAEDAVNSAIAKGFSGPCGKKRRGILKRLRQATTLLRIVRQLGGQLWPGRDQPGLVKFAVTHQQQAVLKLNIIQG